MLKKKWGFVIFSAMFLTLAACGNDGSVEPADAPGSAAVVPTFDTVMKNSQAAIKGGILKYALVMDSPFQGIFSPEFYADAYDSELMGFSHEPLFSEDEDFRLSQDGMATYGFDEGKRVLSLTLKDNLKWSDGEPLTTDDILFSYEVIGHPDYTGIRYGEPFTNIIGMAEYHNGTAKTISGIQVVDDTHLTIEYIEANASILQSGGGVWGYPMPRHQLGSISIADMASSPEIRENPVSAGPFRVKSIIPGQSVTFEANEYYWKGKPKLDGIIAEVVGTEAIVSEMEAGRYDIASMPTSSYDTYKELENITLLGRDSSAYTYIGFKLGQWDEEAGENVLDPDAKMADVNLRKAMAYAIDNYAIAIEFYDGLRESAVGLIPPVFEDYRTRDTIGFYLDAAKANQILDDAGYEDRDGDGFRETPEGEALEIKFAAIAGGETAEPIVQYYIQQWEAIGLDVSLSTGSLIAFQTFYDMIGSDSAEIDVFQASWRTGSDPNPTELYGRTAILNYTRWTDVDNDAALEKINSSVSLDKYERIAAYKEWQAVMYKEVPVIPTLWRKELFAVNNRVKGYDITYGAINGWEVVALTSENPVR